MSIAQIQVPDDIRSPPAPGVSRWTAPKWVQSLYSTFPLVTLEQEDELEWREAARHGEAECSLWIQPSGTASHPHRRPWASPHPPSLRIQLLLLLRDPPVRVQFRHWTNSSAAPGGTLPTLHLPTENRLVPTDEIRRWLDKAHPLKGKGKELQGMPSQEAYDRALAFAQLVLNHLYPAYLASLPTQSADLHLLFPIPPPLASGFTTPLPAALTGDTREIDTVEVVAKGVDAMDALQVILAENDTWALGARQPTPLDALLASHLYAFYSLPETSGLRSALHSKPLLGDYVDRVLTFAGAKLQ